ncbi:uncharacterized protein QC761_101295 [Podospora bellae-mahoneyi]|uniref:Uncharacterized protein n=1 Tax=Podospora bellae-mahoneyi TaxID=2093777 RepID=A0ABR0FTW9_9PEZI|nr:hypothetical protein QC761_101295 [Podospora bellae-mahoneyi]
MGASDLLAEIESGGSTRYPRDKEDLTYKKPVANLAAKEKAEKYNHYYYATGPISCGSRSKPTPVYHPPNWVYAPGDTPRPSLDKETIPWTSSSSSNHDQEIDVIPQIDTVNEAVAAVEPTTNKAVHTKANEADDHINSDQEATFPFDGTDVDSLVADTITPSSRRAKALKKTRGAGSSPKIPSSSLFPPILFF